MLLYRSPPLRIGRRFLSSAVKLKQRSPSVVRFAEQWKYLQPTNNAVYIKQPEHGGEIQRDEQLSHKLLGKVSPVLIKLKVLRLFRLLVLPKGFPNTMHPNYINYVRYSLLQVLLNSTSRLLATQSMLLSVGVGAGSLPMAAVLNWLLKDGVGQFGSIIFGSVINTRFDSDPKRFRFIAVFLGQLANLLGVLSLASPVYFLLFTSLGSFLSRVGTVFHQSCRARIYENFAIAGNLGDAIRGSQAQSTLATLLGTVLGVAASPLIGGDIGAMLMVFVPVSALVHYFAYKSGCMIHMPTLNQQRAELLFSKVLEYDYSNNQIRLVQPVLIPSVEDIAKEESFIVPYTNIRTPLPSSACSRNIILPLLINPDIEKYSKELSSAFNMSRGDQNRNNMYYLHVTGAHSPLVLLWYNKDATAMDVLQGLFHAYIVRTFPPECSIDTIDTLWNEFSGALIASQGGTTGGWKLNLSFIDDTDYRIELEHTADKAKV